MEIDNQIPQEQFEEIERFLQGRMSAEEEAHFSQTISANSDLRKQVEEIRLILLGIEESVLEEKLHEYRHRIPAASVRPLYRRGWLAAAAVIGVLIVGAWWFLQSAPANKRLFTEYFHPEPGLATSMGSVDNYAFERAMVDYKTGDFNTALKAWNQLQAGNPANDTLDYFIGSAYLALKKGDSAIIHFRKVIANDQSVFRDDANWYLGLSLLLNNKITEAVLYIEQSSHNDKESLLSKIKQ